MDASPEASDIKVVEGDKYASICHYFEKISVFQAKLMLMNNEAWDNIGEMTSVISRKGLRGIIGVIQKITGEVKFHDRYKMNESESISLNYVH
jgi:hypothetical protein